MNGLWLLNALAWAAVVCGGFFAWRSHEKTRKAGDSKPEMVKCCSCEGAIGAQEIQNQEKDEVNAEK